MGNFLVRKANGLYGEVSVQSAKNALLPIISACALIEAPVTIKNVSMMLDVEVMLDVLCALGAKYRLDGDNLTVDCRSLYKNELPEELTRKIRSSVFLLGPLIARFRKVTLVKSGGCNIGKRPIDIHISGLKKLGVDAMETEVLYLRADKLTGAEITLRFPSVGATENLIMAAVTAMGTTVIKNAAREPEVKCLCDFLRVAGAKIKGGGSGEITVEGVKTLTKTPFSFTPVSDRIEAGTFILAALITGGEILLKNCVKDFNASLIEKVRNNACKLRVFNDRIYIKSKGRGKALGEITAAPYPGFATDLQTIAIAYAATLDGVTVVKDEVFKKRFAETGELSKLGADIKVCDNTATVRGVESLSGGAVKALDLRGGAALVLAGLKAQGETVVENAELIDRGYYKLDEKLRKLGADVTRI